MFKNISRIYKLLAGNMPLGDGVLDSDYSGYWEQRGLADNQIAKRRARIRRRMLCIVEQIEDNSAVLDVGCGTGDLLSTISEMKPSCRLSGIDISPEAVIRTRQKGFDVTRIDVTQVNLSGLGQFDYIILSEIIEYLPNPEKLLLDLKSVARKKIIVTMPNIGFVLFRLRLFFWDKFPITTVFHIREHLCFWSVNDFLYWAKCLGFNVVRTVGIGGAKVFGLKSIMPNLFANHMLYVLEIQKDH